MDNYVVINEFAAFTDNEALHVLRTIADNQLKETLGALLAHWKTYGDIDVIDSELRRLLDELVLRHEESLTVNEKFENYHDQQPRPTH